MTPAERYADNRAIVLYALLDRDLDAFLTEMRESSDRTLDSLAQMLTAANPKHSASTRDLNAIGAGLVEREQANRVVAIRAVARAWDYPYANEIGDRASAAVACDWLIERGCHAAALFIGDAR